MSLLLVMLLSVMSGADRGEGVLEPGGSVRLLDEVTVVDDTTDFTGPQLVVVERVEEADLPLAFPGSENRIAPFYRFSSDEGWWAIHQGLQARVRLPEGADPYGLAVQMFITREGIEHDLDMLGFWAAVPATYDSVTHEAVFSLRVLRPSGLYVTFSSGNFPIKQMGYAGIERCAWRLPVEAEFAMLAD